MLLSLISVVSTPTHSVATDLALSLGNWATNLATNQRRGLCASTGQLIQPLIPISRSIYQHYNSVLDSSKLHSSTNAEKKPPSPSWNFGGWYYAGSCTFKNHHCLYCNQLGHHEEYSQRLIAVRIENHPTRCRLDAALDMTVIWYWLRFDKPSVIQANYATVSTIGGKKFSKHFKYNVIFWDSSIIVRYFIIKTKLNLLGLDWFDRLRINHWPPATKPRHAQSIKNSPQHLLIKAVI